jgi:hypothetical protein
VYSLVNSHLFPTPEKYWFLLWGAATHPPTSLLILRHQQIVHYPQLDLNFEIEQLNKNPNHSFQFYKIFLKKNNYPCMFDHVLAYRI